MAPVCGNVESIPSQWKYLYRWQGTCAHVAAFVGMHPGADPGILNGGGSSGIFLRKGGVDPTTYSGQFVLEI
jgi:hypothetical protein